MIYITRNYETLQVEVTLRGRPPNIDETFYIDFESLVSNRVLNDAYLEFRLLTVNYSRDVTELNCNSFDYLRMPVTAVNHEAFDNLNFLNRRVCVTARSISEGSVLA